MTTRLGNGLKSFYSLLVLAAVVVIFISVIYTFSDSTQSSLFNTRFVMTESWSPALTCVLPEGGYKAWYTGIVTVRIPTIEKNCSKLYSGDELESERVKNASKEWKNSVTDDKFLELTEDCSWVRNELSNNLYNTMLEKNFPLAFVLVINKSPQQMFRLLKLLYRPQNVFCIHYDLKSPADFKRTFDNIANCVNNIKIATTIIKVKWAKYDILGAQMNCFSDLVKMRPSLPIHQQWKYAMNLCGTELPVATNHEIVSHLRSLNGSSNVSGEKVKKGSNSWKRIQGGPLPYNITYYKGYAYNALSFEYAQFLVEDPLANEVHEYFRSAKNPEEHFYMSLFMHPGVPGGFRPELKSRYISIERATWYYNKKTFKKCHGKIVHNVCISASGDLPVIISTVEKSHNFFHNKYIEHVDHTVMDCLEERLVRKNQLEYEEECGNFSTS